MTDTQLAPPRTEPALPPDQTVLADAHARSADDVVAALGIDPSRGLTAAQAAERLATAGPNELAEPASRPQWLRFLDQFRSTLILVLIGAAVLAGLVGELKDTIVISIVLLINATIGYVQERRAEHSLEALRRMLVQTARVRRDGRVLEIEAAGLAPGDIVLLEAGDRVPADGRLLVAESVEVDEAAFTGESLPVSKHVALAPGGAGGTAAGETPAGLTPAGEASAAPTGEVRADKATGVRAADTADVRAGDTVEVPLAERRTVLFMNTTLTRGRAELAVTATGMATQIGAVAEALRSGEQQETPLQRRVDGLGKRLALIGVVAVIVYAGLALLRGEPVAELAVRAVALAVATVPEGLPAVLALTLALGVYRMAQRGAVVKRLASVETLGSATVVCSDKTGTLTLNQMTVRALVAGDARYEVSGEGYAPDGAVTAADGTTLDQAPPAVVTFALCNDAHLAEGSAIVGDPTEGALVVLAAKLGVDAVELRQQRPRLAELPFDAAHKYMATYHAADPTLDGGRAPGGGDGDGGDGGRGSGGAGGRDAAGASAAGGAGAAEVHVKGAVDVLLERCSHWATADGVVPLDDLRRAEVLAEVQSLASQGLRVLGAATARLDSLPSAGPSPDGGAPHAGQGGHAGQRGADGRDGGSDGRDGEADDRDGEADNRDGEARLRDGLTGLTLTGLVGIADPPRPEARDAVALCQRAGVAVKMITGDHADTATAIAHELGIRGRTMTGAELDRLPPGALADQIEEIGVLARVAPHHKVAIVEALRERQHVVAMTGDGVNDAAALRSADIGVAMGITGTEVTKEAADMVLADDDFATIAKAVREGRAIYDNILKFIRFQLSTNAGAVLTFLGAAVAGVAAPLTAIQVLWVNIIMDGPPAMTMGVDPARKGIMADPPRKPGEAILSAAMLSRLLRVGVVMATGTLVVLFLARQAYEPLVATTMAFTTFVLFQLVNALNARAGTDSVFTGHLFTNRPLWISLGVVLVLQVMAVQLPLLHGIFDTTALTLDQWIACAAVASSVLVVEETVKLAARLARRAPRGTATDAG